MVRKSITKTESSTNEPNKRKSLSKDTAQTHNSMSWKSERGRRYLVCHGLSNIIRKSTGRIVRSTLVVVVAWVRRNDYMAGTRLAPPLSKSPDTSPRVLHRSARQLNQRYLCSIENLQDYLTTRRTCVPSQRINHGIMRSN